MTVPFRPDPLFTRALNALPTPQAGGWLSNVLTAALGETPPAPTNLPDNYLTSLPVRPAPAPAAGVAGIMAQGAPQPGAPFGSPQASGYANADEYARRFEGVNRQGLGGLAEGVAHIPADIAATPDLLMTENLAPTPQYVSGVPVSSPGGPSLAQILARRVRPLWDRLTVDPLTHGAEKLGDVVAGGAPQTQEQAGARAGNALVGNVLGWELGGRGWSALNELRKLRNAEGLFVGDRLNEPVFRRLMDELPNRGDGFTFDPRTGEMAKSGIMVGGHPAQVGGGNANPIALTDERAMRDFLLRNRQALSEPGVMFGGWGQPEGMIIDLANDAGTAENAQRLMNARNEKAAFNLDNFEEIANPYYNEPRVAEVAIGRDAAGNVVTNAGRTIREPAPFVPARSSLPNPQAPAPTGSLMFDRPLLNDAGEAQPRRLLRTAGPAEARPRPGATPAEVAVATDAQGNALTNHGRVIQDNAPPARSVSSTTALYDELTGGPPPAPTPGQSKEVRMLSHTTKTVPMEGTPYGVGDEHYAWFELPDGNQVSVVYSRPAGSDRLRVAFTGATNGENSVGIANARAIKQQLMAENPGATGFDGRRISGARIASGAGPSEMSITERPRRGLLTDEQGQGGVQTLGGMVLGGAGGATAGAQVGDTPEERFRNGFLGLGAGMVLGGGGALGLTARGDAEAAGLLRNERGAAGRAGRRYDLVHMSPERLTTIDPKYAGSGTVMRGAERRRGGVPKSYYFVKGSGRFEDAFDPRRYGRNLVRHDVSANLNLYDPSKPVESITRAYQRGGADAFEKALKKAGYNGYLSVPHEDSEYARVAAVFDALPVGGGRRGLLGNRRGAVGVPSVPQEPLTYFRGPRTDPADLNAAYEMSRAAFDPQNPALQPFLERGFSYPHAPMWYDTGDIFGSAQRVLGDEAGTHHVRSLLGDYMSAVTARSMPPNNFRRAFAWKNVLDAGLVTPEQIATRRITMAPGFGHMAQQTHQRGLARMLENGGIDALANPKPASFGADLTGNWEPGTFDTVMGQTAIKLDPNLGGRFITQGETPTPRPWAYGPLERGLADAAKEAQRQGLITVPNGLAPTAPYQAVIWHGGTNTTGLHGSLNSANYGSMNDIFNAMLEKSAKMWGVSPERAAELIWREGATPLLPLGKSPVKRVGRLLR